MKRTRSDATASTAPPTSTSPCALPLTWAAPYDELKIITCHLGEGGSICAIDHGRSIDTSMGLTPLEGLMMPARSGDIDPSIVIYLQREKGMSYQEVEQYLNLESGLKGIDRHLCRRARGHPRRKRRRSPGHPRPPGLLPTASASTSAPTLSRWAAWTPWSLPPA